MMIFSRYGEITFRHFQDNPAWAAAAGYDFNFIDCVSASAQCTSNIASNLLDEIAEFPDAEVRYIPVFIIKLSVGSLLLFAMIFAYPLFALVIFFRCKSMKRKYKDDYSDIVDHNLRTWAHHVYRRSLKSG
ncbi:hypothetical protein L8Q54_15445 [Enterobacter kobei]|uniref:hypothetical protein n=1 Tax=Enterobacter kobei TaxID=208224 RepID=UPI002005D4A3|nr:hypothetical protein [Enterobacter kobei]MCK6919661.1 hypothetical protein [Enterobacter kobei]